jgi:branched-chain amino acid transport system ATP-binding protein
MERPILSVTRVNKRFGGLIAINDISFDIQQGEVIGLMGPNGAGKTTLINVLSGEYKPESGTINFKGQDIAGLSPRKICHIGIARTYQIPQPFTNLSVKENILVAAIYGRGIKIDAAEIEATRLLQMVGLSDKKDTLCKNLTNISLKKLELARALASEPALILLDEVGAGSREAEIPQILGTINKIRELGKTVVMVEHIIKVMVEAVDRIIVMDKGEKIAEGPPSKVMEDKKVITAYLG